jgi:hypothetical protein
MPDSAAEASAPAIGLRSGPSTEPRSGPRQGDWVVVCGVLLLASYVPHLWSLTNDDKGDVPYYFDWVRHIIDGRVPYRDFRVEYPPYVFAWFILPGFMKTEPGFQLVFALELLALDTLVKVVLLAQGRRRIEGWRALGPFVVFAVAGAIQYTLYVKRFDLVLGTFEFVAVLALSRGAVFTCGLLLACGTATKVYPGLMVPVFLVWLWKRNQESRFLMGLGLGFVPLALMSSFFPWWNFLAYHQERGLQVESLYASFIWLVHRVRDVPARWMFGHGAYEVTGSLAAQVLPVARVVFGATVLISLAAAAWRAWKDADGDVGTLARLALLPVLAFVTFNYVLSPQYMIWLMGLVALAILQRWSWPLLAICGAVSLTQLIFGPTYWGGLQLSLTLVLCLRNTLLVAAWVGLIVEVLRGLGPQASTPTVVTAT